MLLVSLQRLEPQLILMQVLAHLVPLERIRRLVEMMHRAPRALLDTQRQEQARLSSRNAQCVLLAILEAPRILETLLVDAPAQRALQGNIYPEVPAHHALLEPTQRQQLRLSALCALLASMALRQDK